MSKVQPVRDREPALYATFPRRLKALTVDFIVCAAYLAVVSFLTVLAQDISVVRFLLVMFLWIGLVGYEPMCLWLFGGTFGHRAMNLRVVDNRTPGITSPQPARLFDFS
jgi:uncharacterized RDD family membrane protein YckC